MAPRPRRAVPKRPARKAAAPPPPAQPSSSDEEAIAQASIPAPSPTPPQKGDESEEDHPAHAAPKNQPPPPPPQEEEHSDTSVSGDDEEEEEKEKEEPTRAALKNQPPPPQEEVDSDTSGSDGDEEEEDEPVRAAPPSAPKKQPPQPEKSEDSDTSGDDDDDDEEEEAPPKPAPAKEASASALKPPASAAAATEAKKPGPFNRIWSMDDEVRILEAVAAHQKKHGAFPQPEALMNILTGKLDHPAYGSRDLKSKLGSLKRRYRTLRKKGEVPSNEHDRRILDLSKIIWEGGKTTTAATNNGHDQKGFEEMCELYPYLAEEVKVLESAYPAMCKRKFGKMDDDRARAMDEKIKKQRLVQIRVEMRRADLTKEVTKTLMDLIDG